MDESIIESFKQFENTIKKIILNEYEAMLPEISKHYLNQDSTITKESIIDSKIKPENFQAFIVHSIFDEIINVKCEKNLTIDGKLHMNAKYGEYLEECLIDYFTSAIGNDYGVPVTIDDEMKDSIKYINDIKDIIENNLIFMAFNGNAIEILDKAASPELTAISDNKAIEVLLANKDVTIQEEEKDEQVVNEVNQSYGQGQINIVYLKGKQHIKYVDSNGKVHLVETRQPYEVSRIYRSTMKKLGKEGDLNSDEFFKELTLNHEEIDLTSDKSIDRNNLSEAKANILNAIDTNESVQFEKEEEEIVHNLEKGIHVVEKTNDIVTTEVTDNNKVIQEKHESVTEENVPSLVNENTEKNVEINPSETKETRLISEDEYEQYCMKVINGKKLTPIELQEMDYFDNYYYGESSEIVNSEKEKSPEVAQKIENNISEEQTINKSNEGPTLKMNTKKINGFSTKMFMLIVIPITICIGVIGGIMVFKFLGI